VAVPDTSAALTPLAPMHMPSLCSHHDSILRRTDIHDDNNYNNNTALGMRLCVMENRQQAHSICIQRKD
jgi:hypothetical protein